MIKTCRKADWNVSLNLTWNWTNSWITYITLHLTNNTSAYMRVKRMWLRGWWWFYRVFANNIILVFFWNVYVFVCLLGGEKNMAETLVGKLRRKSNRTLALNVPRPPRPADALFLMLTHSGAPLKYPFPQQLKSMYLTFRYQMFWEKKRETKVEKLCHNKNCGWILWWIPGVILEWQKKIGHLLS